VSFSINATSEWQIASGPLTWAAYFINANGAVAVPEAILRLR